MKPQRTPTPEDKAAHMLWDAWRKYVEGFCEPPHGTLIQFKALLCLGGGKSIVRAVNCHEELLEVLKELKQFESTPNKDVVTIAWSTVEKAIKLTEKMEME